MKDFFDALSDFLSSDLAKDNIWAFVILLIICIVLSSLITSFVYNKILIPLKLRESGDVMPDYKKNLEENKKLREENSMLKSELGKYQHIKKMEEAIESDGSLNYNDNALDGFLKKK